MLKFSFSTTWVLFCLVALSGGQVAEAQGANSGGQPPTIVTYGNMSGDAMSEPLPGVNPLLTSPALVRPTAAVSAQSGGTVVRASIAPAQLGNHRYTPLIDDFQVSVATDTSTAGGPRSTLAVATSLLNPFSLQSCRAQHADEVCQDRHKPTIARVRAACLRNLATPAPAEKPAPAEPCTDGTTPVDDVACDLPAAEYCPAACAQSPQPDGCAPCERLLAKMRETCKAVKAGRAEAIAARRSSCERAAKQKADEKAKQDAKDATNCEVEAHDVYNRVVLACQWRELTSDWGPQLAVSASVDVFPAGFYVDPAGKASGPNEPFGGFTAQVGLTLRPRERLTLSAWGTYKVGRPSGLPYTFVASYYGASAQLAWLAVSFLDLDDESNAEKDNYSRSGYENYVKSGFLPGVALGASAQFLWCVQGDATCSPSPGTQWSIAPFVDTKLSPLLQFRVAVQVSQGPAVDASAVGVTPSVTLLSSM